MNKTLQITDQQQRLVRWLAAPTVMENQRSGIGGAYGGKLS
jgi:hypothetical protein